MSTVQNGQIITNGLVLALDPANPRSYMSGSTSWTDLTSNIIPVAYVNNTIPTPITLQNGYLYFSASAAAPTSLFTGSYYYTQDSRVANLTSSVTLETCVYTFEIVSQGCRPVSPRYSETGSPLGFALLEGSISTEINTSPTGWQTAYGYSSEIGKNKWVYISQTTSDADKKFKTYINGKQLTDRTFTGTPNTGNGYVFGRGYYGGKWNFNGYIAFVRIYNRVLSAEEILQNYNSTKTRFGL